MNRAKSQEINKRPDGANVTLSEEGNRDVKLGMYPVTKVSHEYNNKHRYYDSKSKNIPPWYNRTGPGQYESVDLSKISKRETGAGIKINPLMICSYGMANKKLYNQTTSNKNQMQMMSDNVFTNALPKHRFTEYSKAQLNIDMIEKRKRRNISGIGKNRTDDDIEMVINSVGKIKEY